MMVKWSCCPELVQNHGFRSVEVLLDTPLGSPKNCPRAKGGSVQIRPSRPVSVFMIKPRVCPSRGQFSPVQSRRPLGFGQVLSDQPAASRLEHCEVLGHIGRTTGTIGLCCRVECLCFLGLVPSGFKETPYSLDREDSERWDHGLGLSYYTTGDRILPIERRNTKSPGPRFPLLEARSWQEAKSNLVTVALGKDDRIAWCWTLGPPV
ncbi:hypothetical protein YC2023_072105 [Brassica napus]